MPYYRECGSSRRRVRRQPRAPRLASTTGWSNEKTRRVRKQQRSSRLTSTLLMPVPHQRGDARLLLIHQSTQCPSHISEGTQGSHSFKCNQNARLVLLERGHCGDNRESFCSYVRKNLITRCYQPHDRAEPWPLVSSPQLTGYFE